MSKKSTRLIQKGLLYPTAALVVSLPICMAEQAIASSSFFRTDSQQYQSQTRIAKQTQSLPRSYRDLLSPTLVTPSEDLNNLNSTLAEYQSQLKTLKNSKAKDPLNDSAFSVAISAVESKISELRAKISKLESTLKALDKSRELLSKALETYSNAQLALEGAQTALTASNEALALATASKTQQEQIVANSQNNLTVAQADRQSALENKNKADASLTHQKEVKANALNELQESQIAATTSAQSLAQAQQTLQIAQNNYNTLLIPDPTWTAPTYQKEHTRIVLETIIVEHVETTTTQSANILPDLSHTTWSGAGTGAQGSQPTINQGVVKFSYMMQGVSYTGQTNSPANTPLTLSVDVRNMDANRGIQDNYKIEVFTYNAQGQQNGYAVYNSPQGWHEWTQRSVSVTPTSDVASYKVVLSAIDGGFWWGTYGPEMKNPTLSATITTTTITYEEVITYREEKYYTTEPVLIEGTIQVTIDEGHTKTYTAPEGAVFIASDLRYEAKQRPQCGIDIKLNLQGNSITISATNGAWGDPCGGWYKHVIGTLTYEGAPTAPLINDPSLLPPLQEAQANLVIAEENYNFALSELNVKQDRYNQESTKVDELQQTFNEASLELTEKELILSDAEATYATENNKLSILTSDEELAYSSNEASKGTLTNSQVQLEAATSNKEQAEELVKSDEDSASSSASSAVEASTEVQPLIDKALEIANKEPEPQPEPEPEGSPEIPEVLTADNLMEVELDKVDPTELTPEQAEQLVEAALETFETAEEGSPEYEQALDALYLAAQEDDIVLDEALAEIPGVGQAAQAVVAVLNIVGNVGADISPKARKKAQEVVVTTLVVGQIAQTAAIAQAASGSTFRRRS